MAAPVNSSALLQIAADSTDVTFNAGFTFTAGRDAILTFSYYSSASTITAVTIGGTAAVQDATVAATGGSATGRAYIYRATNMAGGTANVVITYSGGADNYISGNVVEYAAGVLQASPVDVGRTNTAAGSSAVPQVTSLTAPSVLDTQLHAVMMNNSGAAACAISGPTGWTVSWTEQNDSAQTAGSAAYLTSTTINSKTATWAQNSGAWAAAIVVYKLVALRPTITAQPVQQTSTVGATATFSVTATASAGSVTYQWENLVAGTWTTIGGATSSSYTTGTLSATDNGGQYRVVCTDSNGSITSAEVFLFLNGLASAGKGRQHTAWTSFRARQAGPINGLRFLNLRVLPKNGPNRDRDNFVSAWNTWWFPVVAASGATGTLARTNANDTSTASGTTTVLGTLFRTNANDTSVANGTTVVRGTLARTNANDTSAATGLPVTNGTLARTNADDTLAASGNAGISISGTLNTTNANDTSSGAGTTTILATLARTNANDTSAATGSPIAVGSLARTNANDTSSASGTPIGVGSLNRTNANDTVVASGSAGSVPDGTLNSTNLNDTLSSSGTSTVLGILATANNNDTLAASGSTGGGGGGTTTKLPLTGAGTS